MPTLEYASGDVAITDRSTAATNGERRVLRRVLSFVAPRAETLHFRALTGPIEELGERRYRIPRLELTVPDVPVLLRPLEGSETDRELILALPLPEGRSRFEVDYVLD